jgi:diacylglycerol kinase (ATP)
MAWLIRLVRSFGFAFAGLGHVLRTQPNVRIHLVVALVVLLAAVVLQVPTPELAILALTIGFVLAAETLNTAVEAAVDAIGAPPSLAAKHAKDAAAAGVLIAAMTAVVVGVLVLGPRLWMLLGHSS